jgi:outer membrane protein
MKRMALRSSAALFLFLFLILWSLPGRPQEKGKVYTLEKSIEEALENNWNLRATQEKVDQAKMVKNQARADFLPKLGTTYSYTRLSEVPLIRSSVLPQIPLGTQDNYQWKATVTQPLFTGLALISSYRLAELGIDKSETELELGRLDLVLQVKTAYFNILLADKGVDVAEKDVESRKSNVKVARSFYKVGMIPINDLLKAEVELANAEQNLVTARNASRLARSSFNITLSRPVNAPVEVEDISGFEPEKGDFQEYVSKALETRPEMRLVDIGILQTDQRIRLAKSKNYPKVGLTYEYIKEGDSPDVSGSPFQDANSWQVTAGLTWTFWEWGKTHYTVREVESLKRELMQNKLALEDSIRLELREAVLALEDAEENIPTTQKAVEQGEENLRVNEERYKAQVTTITEVLDAQSLLTRARVNYYKALYNHHLARARLVRALGMY